MVNITGIIGEDVTLLDVVAMVKSEPADHAVEVHIDSPGGYVDEGLKIYNYLKGLSHGCNTSCSGECASMGSVIFMAGVERRAGCEIMIHNPFVGEMFLVNATADEIQAEADRLRELQDALAEIYIKTAKLDRNAIQPLMDDETWISPARAVEMGIATAVYTGTDRSAAKHAKAIRAMAFAFPQEILNKQMNNKMSFLDKIIARAKAVAGGDVKALTLKAVDGTEVYVDREEGEIEVGDTASPDGEFQLEDGRMLVIKDGRIEEIRTGGTETELADLQRELQLARATIAQQNAILEKYKDVIEAHEEAAQKKSEGFKNITRDFGTKTPPAKTAEEQAREYAMKRIQERRGKRK